MPPAIVVLLKRVILSAVLFLGACGGPKEGEPCESNERACGEDDRGFECRDGKWKAVCADCVETLDGAACIVSICMADDPALCD